MTDWPGTPEAAAPEAAAPAAPSWPGTSNSGWPGTPEKASPEEHVGSWQSFLQEDMGLPSHVAAGVIGSLQGESGRNLDPNATGDGGRAVGVAQWHPDRQAKAAALGYDLRTTRGAQQFMKWEADNTEKAAWDRIRAARTPEEAAAAHDRYYERSAGFSTQQRMKNARALFGNGEQTTTISAQSSGAQWPGTPEPDAEAPLVFSNAETALPTGAQPAAYQPPETEGVLKTFGEAAAESAISLPGQILQGVAIGTGLAAGDNPRQSSMYKLGQDMEKYAKTWGPSDAARQANPISTVAGSVVGGAAPFVLGAPLMSAGAAVGIGAGAFALSGAATAYNEALLMGADDATAAKAAGMNALVMGGLGAIPLHVALAPIKFNTPWMTGWAAEKLTQAVQSGIAFSTVGEAQEFLGRQIAKNFYDPEAGYHPDVSRVLGGLLGGGIIGTLAPRDVTRMRSRESAPPTQEDIQKSATGLTAPEVPDVPATPERILKPAVLISDTIYTGAFHPDAFENAAKDLGVSIDQLAAQVGKEPSVFQDKVVYVGGPKDLDGFITSHGRYVDREEAAKIAEAQGQIDMKVQGEPPLSAEQLKPWEMEDFSNPYSAGIKFPNLKSNEKLNVGSLIDEIDAQRAYAQAGGKETPNGFTAYHGSPADFSVFDLTKSGTGAGGDAFGKGAAYVGEHPAVGRDYAQRLGRSFYEGKPFDGTNPVHRAALLIQELGSRGAAADWAEASAARKDIGPIRAALDKAAAKVLRSDVDISPLVRMGNLYTVEVKRPKDHFLEWHKPLDMQSDYVKKALEKLFKREGVKFEKFAKVTGEQFYKSLQASDASAFLSEGGIAGTRYPDAGSRRNPENPTYNYVVFKAEDAAITHRNGKPLSDVETKVIADVQAGHTIVDDNGRAIVNGREVENISPEELTGFARPGATAPEAADNGIKLNQQAMKAAGVTDFPDTPMTEASGGGRGILKGLFGRNIPPEAKPLAPAVDHYWRRLRFLWDMRALIDANPHIRELQNYGVEMDHMFRFAAERQVAAEDVVKAAWNLNPKERKGLDALIDSYINMKYLKKGERDKLVVRKPTDAELRKLVEESGVGKAGLSVFVRMAQSFERFTRDMLEIMREKALRNLEPGKAAKELDRLQVLERNLLSRPYFPVTRFGLYTVLIQGPNGNEFYRRETRREQQQLAKELEKHKKPGETITMNKLPQSSLPFGGLPSEMLDFVQKSLLPSTKSEELNNAINQLKYESHPIRSASARFANYSLTPGYSKDFLRSYAHFFFHGPRYLARMKYFERLKGYVEDLRETAIGMPDGTKRSEIAQFTSDHLQQLVDPRGDWSGVRAFLFHMALGFRVASAATNLTQTLISTLPHLSAEFGDLQAMRSLAKATKDVQNFYRYATVQKMTDPQSSALAELMNLGGIRGALAPMLAGLSEHQTLSKGYGGNAIAAAWTKYAKASSFFFEVTEQFNRRVAGMATYDLAMRNPNAKFVMEAYKRDPELYANLRLKHFPEREARAIMAAKTMIDRTQYQYSKEYRPAYMRGPVGSTIFTFKLFTHRMLWNLWNFPAAGMRSALIMAALGGLSGIPGFQDLNGILKAGANWLFGKDFDLEDKAREFAVDMLGMNKGTNPFNDPFTITKGFASRGYGIPALIDFFGEWAGVGNIPIPELDRSAAVSLGNILPIDFGVAFGPKARKDPATAFAEATSRGFGAMGNYTYNVYKAMMGIKDNPEHFRWFEKVEPMFLANMSHAARLYREGAETGQTGSQIVKFDPHDTEHMAEVIATGLGYTPFRTMREWTRIRQEREAVMFWDVRREILLNQYWTTVVSQDNDERKRVIQAIRNFNEEIRGTDARGKGITADTLEKSMQARMNAKMKQEAGVPGSLNDLPLVQGVRRLFPGSEPNVKVQRER